MFSYYRDSPLPLSLRDQTETCRLLGGMPIRIKEWAEAHRDALLKIGRGSGGEDM